MSKFKFLSRISSRRLPVIWLFLFLLLSAVFWQGAKAASYAGLKINIIPGPQCYDGQDNDSDGLTDFPADPECDSVNDNNEAPIIIPPSGGGGGGGGGGGIDITPSTNVVFSGHAYPYNKVTLLKDGQTAIETMAGGDAHFILSLSGLSAGDYNFSIFSQDVHGLQSDAFTFSVYVTKGASTNIGGILLAPTIKLNESIYHHGDSITVFGSSVPNTTISISVHSAEEKIFHAQADDAGIYTYDIDSADLSLGDHNAKSKTLYAQQLSAYSRVVNFKIIDEDEPLLEEEKPEDKAEEVAEIDLNNDKRINLIDFSILAYWYQKSTPPPAVDLNNDNKVNLIDFSILAYYWTG